jgi:hypothetical protein
MPSKHLILLELVLPPRNQEHARCVLPVEKMRIILWAHN